MTTESTDRAKCPVCAESIALEARLCPHCRQSALLDVLLDGPVSDGRLRYQIARQMARLGPPFPDLLAAQKRLDAPQPVIVEGVTALDGRRALDLVGQHNLCAHAVPAGKRGRVRAVRRGRGASSLAVWAAVALAVIVVGVPLIALVHWLGDGAGTARTTEQIAAAVLPSTVSVQCGAQMGAGFFVEDDVVLTNAHVLGNDCEPISVKLSDGRDGPGERSRVLDDVDLALIRVRDVTAKPLVLGDAGETKVGEKVLLVGSPKGFEFSVHEGLVSSVSRTGLGTAYLQLDAKINPGNSGGPAIDMRGRVIGVVTMKRTDAEGIGFALPINYAFTGSTPLVLAPSGIDPARFGAMLARASDDERRQAEEFEAAIGSYALLRATLEPEPSQWAGRYRLVLYVGLLSETAVTDETYQVHVWSGKTRVCSLTMRMTEWALLRGGDLRSRVDPRTASWLGRKQIDAETYIGKGILGHPPCAVLPNDVPGYVVEIEGAEPQHARLPVGEVSE